MIRCDTSVLSPVFRRRHPGPEERRLQAVFEELMARDEPLGVPGMVLQEVLSGVRPHRHFGDLSGKLLAAFTIVPAGILEHVEAARLRNVCLGKGLNVSGIDCLIAACAIKGNRETRPLKVYRGHDPAWQRPAPDRRGCRCVSRRGRSNVSA